VRHPMVDLVMAELLEVVVAGLLEVLHGGRGFAVGWELEHDGACELRGYGCSRAGRGCRKSCQSAWELSGRVARRGTGRTCEGGEVGEERARNGSKGVDESRRGRLRDDA
jgi:hypothetical protein